MAPETCPNCGADIPPKAKVCPECGADEETGWSEEAHANGLGIPDGNFDYNEFVREEFGPKSPLPRGINWWWWVIAILLVVAVVFAWVL